MGCHPRVSPEPMFLVRERALYYTRLVVVLFRRPPPPRPQVRQPMRTPKKLTMALTMPVIMAPMPLMTAIMPVNC